jgi:glucosamine 6-phosphate synthetase-like amidotransferase/phosphosugar isomerase protein
MCGIFGAIGNSINHEILVEIAGEALKRGPQAYGLAYFEDENICIQKYASAIKPKKAFKGLKPRSIIGNCRLATSGSFMETANNQPMEVGETAISHNGNIRSYLQIAEEEHIQLDTGCDSEIICHLVNAWGAEKAIRYLSAEMPMALLILQKNKITAYRQGQPLYALSVDGCHYFCSRRFAGAEALEEGRIYEFGG